MKNDLFMDYLLKWWCSTSKLLCLRVNQWLSSPDSRGGGQKPWWASSAVILAEKLGDLGGTQGVKPQGQNGSQMFAQKNYPKIWWLPSCFILYFPLCIWYDVYISIYFGKSWRPHCDLSGTMGSKRNHPQLNDLDSGLWNILIHPDILFVQWCVCVCVNCWSHAVLMGNSIYI